MGTRSLETTRRRSTASVTRQSSGWTQTSLPRWTSTPQSRRRLRECATPSSPSCTELVEEHQEDLTWEGWAEVLLLVLEQLEVREGLDLLSRKWTKSACNQKPKKIVKL